MTKEIETLGLVQSDSFNYQRYSTYIMDSWADLDCPATDLSRTKPRLNHDDELSAITMLYDQCKSQKEQRMTACSRGSSMHKPTERTLTNSSPEVVSMETPVNIMKLLSESISSSHAHQDGLPPLCPASKPSAPLPPPSETYTTLAPSAASADSYDKLVINNIFDSLLQKWPTETAFPETPAAQMPYSASFSSQASPVYSETYSNSPRETYSNSPRESYSEFQFWLGAPPASQHKASSLPLVYLNKGQFYPITLQGVNGGAGLANSKVKTVVMAVFENDKSPEMQLKCWNHWHGRQPTAKQRVIDIADYKEVFSGISSVEEVAFNALSFIWNPNQEAKVHIGINSLSTDFSSQKGVKGLPLNLQIDTYDFSSGSNRLLHRAACQVKVFCDKGAERKMRDEERKRSKRRGGKNVADSSNSNSRSVVSSSVASESTLFGTLEDHVTQPVLFIPEMHLSSLQRCGLAPPSALVEEVEKSSLKRLYPDRDASPPCKQARQEETQRVLLYVRTETEEVFDALMLNTPNLTGLREAISEKYGMQKDTIGKIYKKCKRGIFVNMDDNIIQHYSNHSAFLLELSEGLGGPFHVTLMEL